MKGISRRTVLRLTAIVGISALSGCQGDFPSSRVIDFVDVSVEQANDDWEIITTVRTRDNTGRGFHNVRIVGRSAKGNEICSEEVGDLSVSERQSEVPVSLVCPSLPVEIVPLSEASPCEEDTFVHKRVYDSNSDTWEEQTIECDEVAEQG